MAKSIVEKGEFSISESPDSIRGMDGRSYSLSGLGWPILAIPFYFAGLVLWYNYYRFGSIFETGFQLLAAKTGIDFFSGTLFLTGLRGLLTSSGKGFFYCSPIAIFFLLLYLSIRSIVGQPSALFY